MNRCPHCGRWFKAASPAAELEQEARLVDAVDKAVRAHRRAAEGEPSYRAVLPADVRARLERAA